MSSNYLFSYLLETADLPMTGLQKMLRTLYAEYPVISVAGVLDRDGNYINAAAAADLPLIRDYSYMQYNYLVKHAKTASEFSDRQRGERNTGLCPSEDEGSLRR